MPRCIFLKRAEGLICLAYAFIMSAYMSLVITPRGEMPFSLIPEFKELITTERRISLLETSNGRQ